MSILRALSRLVDGMNRRGVPLPMVREKGQASMTATMTWISFNTCIIGQFGKLAGFFGGVDLTQANYLFLICLGAYLGRRMSGNGKTGEGSLDAPAPTDKKD